MFASLTRILNILVLTIMLTACYTAATPQPAPLPQADDPPTPNPAEPVTITWSYWGDPWEVEINQKVVEVFERDNPDIHVETIHRPWNDYITQFRADFEAGKPVPDVLFWTQAPIDIPKGYFMDLAPKMTAENYTLDDFFPGLLVHFKMGDKIYGLPRDSDTKVIYYNKRLFNRADVAFPKDNWRWADLRAAALAIKDAGVADYGFAYEVNDWWMIWMWQNGVQLFDDRLFPTKTYLGDPAAAEAVQFLADLTNKDQVTPPYDVLKSSENIANLFKEQKVAMVFGNHALIPAFSQVEDFEWDVVNLPQQKRVANLAAGAGYVLAANTAHPDEAWRFLKFLSGPKGQAIFAESGIAVPSRRSVAESDIFMGQERNYNAQTFLDAVEIGEPDPAFPGANQFLGLMNNEVLPPVWQGQEDAATAIQAALPKIEQILAKNQPPAQ